MDEIWSGRTKDGIEVHIDVLHITRTYAGLLLGAPNEKMNQDIILRAAQKAQSFSSLPVHVVPPFIVMREIPRPYPELPPVQCIGEFVSYKAKDEESPASGLVIVWFQNRSPVTGLDLPLDNLDWWAHARDFWF